MIKLSVVIPTFNRGLVLQRSLTALLEQDLSPAEYEIIVIIDGSTDSTSELLCSWKPQCAFRVIEAPHRGPAAARNVGIQAAVGELVLFLDDDLIGGPDLLRQHCAAHSASEPRVVHGPIYVAPDSSRSVIRHITERFYESYYRPLNPDMEFRYPTEIGSSVSVLSSLVNSSMPRDVLLESGGFDEQILAAEDLELGLRLWKMGLSFRYLPVAIAHEYYVKSSREYLRGQAKALGVGDLRVSRKHPEYRPYSALSGLAQSSTPMKWLRAALVRSSVFAIPLLAFPLRFEEQFYRFPLMLKAGVRLLGVADKITQLRSALSIAGSWKALESEFGRRCPSAMYHHVGPAWPGSYESLTVSPEKFERQIRWLACQGYNGIKPSDWLRWLREGTGLPEKPILITFDDAYLDTAEYALPILQRFGFGAAVFVVTHQIGGTNAWDEAQGCATLRLMNAEQIQYWAERGIEFGAHSRTHADLTTLSAAECVDEIVGSRNDLEALLDSPVVSFAYPYGILDNAVHELVKGEFGLAFSTEEGINYLRGDRHLLRRADISPSYSLSEFAFCVRWGGLERFRAWYTRFGVRTRLRRAVKSLTRFAVRMSAGRERNHVPPRKQD